MSKNTKKANAAFTGLGKTKKILLGDTLTNEFTNDEIETVIAHELGHYKHKHIIINIFVSTISSFLTLYLISVLYTIYLLTGLDLVKYYRYCCIAIIKFVGHVNWSSSNTFNKYFIKKT